MAALTPHEVGERILTCVNAAIVPPVTRVGSVPGEIAWDDCQCGQLAITQNRRFGSRSFPLEEIDHTAECGEPWLVVQYTLSLTRCVPVPDSNGNPPTMVALGESALQLSDDMTKVRIAVNCCLSDLFITPTSPTDEWVWAYELGAQEVVGPQGGCAGSDLTIFVGWTQDCEC